MSSKSRKSMIQTTPKKNQTVRKLHQPKPEKLLEIAKSNFYPRRIVKWELRSWKPTDDLAYDFRYVIFAEADDRTLWIYDEEEWTKFPDLPSREY